MIDLKALRETLVWAKKEYNFDVPGSPANIEVANRLGNMAKTAGDAMEIICACTYFAMLLVRKGGAPSVDLDNPDDYYKLDPGKLTGPRLTVLQMFTAYLNGDEQTAYALAQALVLQGRETSMTAIGHAAGFAIRAMRNDWVYVEGDDDQKIVGGYYQEEE